MESSEIGEPIFQIRYKFLSTILRASHLSEARQLVSQAKIFGSRFWLSD